MKAVIRGQRLCTDLQPALPAASFGEKKKDAPKYITVSPVQF